MTLRSLVFSILSFLISVFACASVESAPITETKIKEIDPEVVRAYEKMGADYGYFSLDEYGTGVFKRKPEGTLIPGFTWRYIPNGGLPEFPQVNVPFGIDLAGQRVTIQDLQRLGGLNNLRLLNLRSCQMSEAVMKQIAKCPDLEYLHLTSTDLDDRGLTAIKSLKHVRSLGIALTKVTDTGLKEIVGFEELRYFTATSTSITSKGASVIGAWKQLQRLVLEPKMVSDDLLKGLNQSGRLYALTIFKDMKNENCRSYDQVDKANMTGCPIGNDALKEIVSFKNLKELTVNSTLVDDDGLKHLSGMRNLISLRLQGTRVHGTEVKALSDCKNLTLIDFSQEHMTDNVIRDLKRVGLLHTLAFVCIGEPGPGQPITRPRSCDDVRWLRLDNMPLTGTSMEELSSFKNLETLIITCRELDDRVAAVLPKFARLKILHLDCRSIPVKTMENLVKIHDLERFWIVDKNVDDEMLSALIKSKLVSKLSIALNKKRGRPASFEDVASLNLSFTVTTAASVKEILALKELETVNFGPKAVLGVELKDLAELKKLRRLDLSCSGVNLEGIKQLKYLTSLKELGIGGALIFQLERDAAWKELDELRKTLPECKIR